MTSAFADPDSALHVLLALTRALADEQSLEDALRATTDAALRLLPCDHASLRLLDAGSTALLCGARSGVGVDARPMTFVRGEGIMGWAVAEDESVRVDDTANDARFVAWPRQGFEVRSVLVEPLRSAGRIVGVLSVSSREPHAFSDEDQLLCRLLANCSVPPIERARLERLAVTDDMTLAYNVRYLAPRLADEMERARRHGTALSVALLDLDHFKRVNDVHGHEVGDRVLRAFANRAREMVRRIDALVRRGGEEFLLVLPSTSLDEAAATAERLRAALASAPIDVGLAAPITQTVSVGVATWDGVESAAELQRRADAAMYASKRAGRDRVSVSPPSRGV